MTASLDLADLVLPDGARLVHIGPSKTGTTSLQGAMWAARAEMRRQGIRYLGQSRHSGLAARAVAGMSSPYSNQGKPPSMRHWQDIVREARRAGEPRAIFSSEYLAHAPRASVERVVRDLDATRVHVAVTLRPLPKMLGSRWQQGVQAGSTVGFPEWLEQVLGRSGELPKARMWAAHRHDRLVQLWADVVGPERVTVVVVSEQDHAWILRAFEALAGLRSGTLQLQDDADNRSLTYEEVEAVRALNLELGRLGVGRRTNRILVHNGAARHMKHRAPGPEEHRIVPPAWAVARAAEVADQAVAGIMASGVRIVGDLHSLRGIPSGPATDPPDHATIPTDIALALVTGVLRGAGILDPDAASASPGRRVDQGGDLPSVPDRRLLRLYASRKRTDATRFVRGLRGAPAPED